VAVDVEDDVALAGADGVGIAADGEGEGGLFEDVAEATALEVAEVAAGRSGGAAGGVTWRWQRSWRRPKLAGDAVGLGWAASSCAWVAFSGWG
jgi:hypothetical protein